MQQRRRSRLISGLLALGLLAGVALTASPAQAVDGVGPYYSLPSWDRNMPVANRFVVLTNWNSEAVLDKETGLVWERSPLTTTHPWDLSATFSKSAIVQCTSRTTGGKKGWRLPSVHELASLVDPANSNPSLPTGHPFTVLSSGYWSATALAVDPTRAWFVLFFAGDESTGAKSNPLLAWCVRGGNNADAY